MHASCFTNRILREASTIYSQIIQVAECTQTHHLFVNTSAFVGEFSLASSETHLAWRDNKCHHWPTNLSIKLITTQRCSLPANHMAPNSFQPHCGPNVRTPRSCAFIKQIVCNCEFILSVPENYTLWTRAFLKNPAWVYLLWYFSASIPSR